LSDVPRSALLAVYDAIGGEAPYEANRTWAVIRAVYNYAVDELGYSGPNPTYRLPKTRRFKEQANERYLRPTELGPFLDALDGYDLLKMSDYFRLLLYTGARRRNAEAARWENVNFAEKTWTLPDTKSGKAVVVPLTPDALAVLMRRRAAVPDACPWVFPGRVGDGHLVEPMTAWRAILKAAKITERTRIHDLRHTLSTYMAEGNAPESTIADALGHIGKGSVTARYTHTRLATIRAAVSKAIDLMHRHAGRLAAGMAAKLA
jgi:integrase